MRFVYRTIFLSFCSFYDNYLTDFYFVPRSRSCEYFSIDRRRETADVHYNETPFLEMRAKEKNRIKANFADTKFVSITHNASCCPGLINTAYMCMISLRVHFAYYAALHARPRRYLSGIRATMRNNNAEDAWKFSRELLPEAAQPSLFVYLAFPQIRVCETVHAIHVSTYISLFLSFSSLYPLHHFTSAICNVPDFNAAALSP